MNIKTKDLIKILPFENSFRKKLFAQFDNLPLGKKYEIVDLLWRSYEAWYGLKLEQNTQLALLAAKDGKGKLDKDFYKKVKEKTDREVGEGALETVEKADLEEARKAMEFIVKEIKATKRKTT